MTGQLTDPAYQIQRASTNAAGKVAKPHIKIASWGGGGEGLGGRGGRQAAIKVAPKLIVTGVGLLRLWQGVTQSRLVHGVLGFRAKEKPRTANRSGLCRMGRPACRLTDYGEMLTLGVSYGNYWRACARLIA
ncbi:hypothetical protein D3C81_740290 [compost metagenome]